MMSSELSQHFQTKFVYQWHHNFMSQHMKQRPDVILFVTFAENHEMELDCI